MTFRQENPGRDNPQGRIKFKLPIPHAVHLHDTPGKDLARLERAFSSGSIGDSQR
jgi:murein L,D-transpeptidase YcbB/YkuD